MSDENQTETTAHATTEKTDAELRQDKVHAVTRETMLGDLRAMLLRIFRDPRNKNKPWQKMTEEEQRDMVNWIEEELREVIARATDIIRSDGRNHIKVLLESVTVKDEIKGVIKCAKDHELRHALTDAPGSFALLVISDIEAYLGASEPEKIDKDQPQLHDKETGELLEPGAADQAEAKETQLEKEELEDEEESEKEASNGGENELEREAAQYT